MLARVAAVGVVVREAWDLELVEVDGHVGDAPRLAELLRLEEV